MTQIARYVIVLDRYDDDDYLQTDSGGTGLNDGTENGGCEQVAAELQEAMDRLGTPAGFFNVIAREVWTAGPDHVHVAQADPAELREPTAAMLLKPARTQGPRATEYERGDDDYRAAEVRCVCGHPIHTGVCRSQPGFPDNGCNCSHGRMA